MNTTLPDVSPLTDDLDDLSLHEPVTKENDMNEARASATAQEPADTKAVMNEFDVLLKELRTRIGAAQRNGDGLAPGIINRIREFVQHLAFRASQEPAATASRTVSDEPARDEAALKVWLADHTSNGWVREGHLESLFAGMRLIPAPSVAEPAKCGTCRGTKRVPWFRPEGKYLPPHGTKPCPDCTPASAEQNTCKACHGTKKLQLYRPMSQGGGVLHESPCSLCACHAAEGGQNDA